MDLFAPPPSGSTYSNTILAKFPVTISGTSQVSNYDIAPGTYNMAPDGDYVTGCQVILGITRCDFVPYTQTTITVDSSGNLTPIDLNIYQVCP
jgi:hypothetical protein